MFLFLLTIYTAWNVLIDPLISYLFLKIVSVESLSVHIWFREGFIYQMVIISIETISFYTRRKVNGALMGESYFSSNIFERFLRTGLFENEHSINNIFMINKWSSSKIFFFFSKQKYFDVNRNHSCKMRRKNITCFSSHVRNRSYYNTSKRKMNY